MNSTVPLKVHEYTADENRSHEIEPHASIIDIIVYTNCSHKMAQYATRSRDTDLYEYIEFLNFSLFKYVRPR
jgi:hypothetical protein